MLVQLFLLVQLVQLVQLFLLAKAHKILVFVLGKPEKGGPEGRKRTKTLILCSKCPKTRVPDPKSAQKCRFCARKARKWGLGRAKAHKKPDFVLETPENRGLGGRKRTKTPILCSGRLDWHQGESKLASESATVAFLQITAHASKIQIPHNQTINFQSRAR